MIEFDIKVKSLWCEYCKRFCDENCVLCEYLKEAEFRPREEQPLECPKKKEKEDKKEDEEKEAIKNIAETFRTAMDSLRSSDVRRDLCRFLSSCNTAELVTLSNAIAFELCDRHNNKWMIDLLFSQLFASLNVDADFLLKIQEKVEKEVLK